MENFPRYWPFVRGIHRSPVNSPHKGQWRGALIFSLICAWINVWVNNREAGGLRCHCVHYDDIVMIGSVFHNRNDNMIIFLKYTRKCLDEWNFIYLSYTPLPEYRWVNLYLQEKTKQNKTKQNKIKKTFAIDMSESSWWTNQSRHSDHAFSERSGNSLYHTFLFT